MADGLAISGLLVIAVGFGLVYPPLGVIVLGAEALLLALGWGRR